MIAPISQPTARPPARLLVALAIVVPITLVHYVTDVHAVELHNVYRRLYYVPIVLGAFASGIRGGVGIALLASVAYAPHAFFSEHPDPAPMLDKLLEILLYVAIGFLTGWLVEQQNRVRNELQESLHKHEVLEAELVRAGKLSALGELSSGLVHEIRNPLASILGAAESLVAEFDSEHRKFKLGQLLIREVDRLNGVVTRFASFARPAKVERATTDLMEAAREVCDLSRAQAGERGVDVEVEDSELLVEVDREQVVQVLLNLLLNAYGAAQAHEEPRVTVAARKRAVGSRHYRCLVVTDNGEGVPEELREQVFDPFFTTRDDGTGLGLSISARIMEAHGGLIELHREGEATEAWLCFPEAL